MNTSLRWFTFHLPRPVWNVPDATPGTPPAEPPKDPPAAAPPADPAAAAPPNPRTVTPPTVATSESDKPAAVPADWPADWREKLAGGDAKALERLKRFPSPGDLGKSFFEADKRINSGKANADEPMPDPAKDAEGAKAWREARGIPPDATGYKLPDELSAKLIDEDRPILAGFYEYAHGKGMPQAQVQANVEWYLGLQEQQAEARNAADKQQADAVEEAMRAEWGSDFKPNRTIAATFAKEVIPGVDLFNARLADGRMIGNIPEVVRGFAEIGRMKYGDVAFAGGEKASATENRMAELKKIMETDIDKWNASPDLRKEYFGLLDASDKRNNRGAA